MPKYLRIVRKGRWSQPPWTLGASPEWQADSLQDLQTSQNTLSVYLVADAEATNQVVAGLAANRDYLSNLDYTIIDEDRLPGIELRTVEEPGTTLHGQANQLHRNIVNLTVRAVLAIVQSIPPGSITRIPFAAVCALVKQEIESGHIDRQKVSKRIFGKLYP